MLEAREHDEALRRARRARRRVAARSTPGTFHALLGENGAGKSTLVKCIMGFYQADAGEVEGRRREPSSIKSPRDAQALGIGMVYQHFTLVENMTVAENLVLARATLPRVIDWKKEQQAIDAFMDEHAVPRAGPERWCASSPRARSRSSRS